MVAWQSSPEMNEEQQQNEEQKMNEKQQPTSQKPHWMFSQAKYQRWKFLLSQPPIKKMITEALLILHLYLIWFFIWWRFRYLIKAMADVESFAGTADTPKEGIEQHKKQEYLKSTISKGKILGGKNNGHMKN